MPHIIFTGIVDGDLCGEILGFQDDGGGKVGQWAVIRYLPAGFHGFGAAPEQGSVAFAADQGKVIIAAGLFIDHMGKLFFGCR